MKIKDLIYKTPEITEEKLLEFIDNNLKNPSYRIDRYFIKRISGLHKGVDLAQTFLDEYDLIQDKKSFLTKGQRDLVIGFVGLCMIQMVKNDGTGNSESTSNN